MTARSVALVEDDPILQRNFADVLQAEGFEVSCYGTEHSARKAFSERLPSLALLDVHLPDQPEGGYSLCSWLRQRAPGLPIIFLTSLSKEVDKISGLRLGADDYITKDSSIDYVVIRIHALFRRFDTLAEQGTARQMEFDALRLDDGAFQAFWRGRLVDLTLTQYWMLRALVTHSGRVLSHRQLMSAARIQVEPNTIVAHVQAIRRKFREIDPSFTAIRTSRGNGYTWTAAGLSDENS